MAQDDGRNGTPLWIPNLDTIRDGDSNYLGDPIVVDAILRKFLADAIAVRDAYLRGDPGAEDPTQWLEEHARRGAEIFLGRANDYTPISPEWNGPQGGIVNQVRRRFDMRAADPETVLAVPFYALIAAYLDAETEAAEGRDWEHLIDGAIELSTATLLGVDDQTFPFEVGA